MSINIDKCVLTKFSRKRNKHNFQYRIDNQELKRVEEVRYPDVIIDSELRCNGQINHVIKKSFQDIVIPKSLINISS